MQMQELHTIIEHEKKENERLMSLYEAINAELESLKIEANSLEKST